MSDENIFEERLERRLRAHAATATDRQFDIGQIATAAVRAPRREGILGRVAWSSARPTRSIALVGLLVALGLLTIGFALFAGGRSRDPLVSVDLPSQSPSSLASTDSARTPYPVLAGEPWIAYMGAIGGADTDRVWLVRPDGSDRHQLETGLDGQQEHPDWSPDGSRIVFDHWYVDPALPGDSLDLWTMNADGSDPTRIASCEPPCRQLAYPSWSPDGSEIVLIRFEDDTGPSAIEILDLDSGTRRVVLESTDGSVVYQVPRWSPDGQSIAFTLETYSDATETTLVASAIAVIHSDGSDGDRPLLITPPALLAAESDWHPTDARIVFRSHFDPSEPKDRTLATDIYSVGSDGTGLTNLTNLGLGDLRAIQPSWTPDGKEIVFTQVDGFGGAQIPAIARMGADGTNVTRLGFGAGTAPRMRPILARGSPRGPTRSLQTGRSTVSKPVRGRAPCARVDINEDLDMSFNAFRRLTLPLMTLTLVTACGAGSTALPTPLGPTPTPTITISTPTLATSTPIPTPSLAPAALADGAWIAYQGGTGGPPRIRLVRPDGTEDHEFAPGAPTGGRFHPDWSHDGRRIAFAVDDTDGTRDIWVAAVDGSPAERVHDCESPCVWTDAPAWSPDDTALVFEHGFTRDGTPGGPGGSTIELLTLADGTTRSVITTEPSEYAYVPDWSPDGDRIVFEIDRFATEAVDDDTVVARTIGLVGLGDPKAAFRADCSLGQLGRGAALATWDRHAGIRPADGCRQAVRCRRYPHHAGRRDRSSPGHRLRCGRRVGDPTRLDTRWEPDPLHGRGCRAHETECRDGQARRLGPGADAVGRHLPDAPTPPTRARLNIRYGGRASGP